MYRRVCPCRWSLSIRSLSTVVSVLLRVCGNFAAISAAISAASAHARSLPFGKRVAALQLLQLLPAFGGLRHMHFTMLFFGA
jgi:hypothetical protein